MRRLYSEFLGGARGLALLLLRATAGAAMMFHGWGKIQHPTTWLNGMAPAGQAPPGFLQAIAAGAEFFGGACWILGLLTPIASFLIFGTMFVATFMVHVRMGHPFVSDTHGPAAESAAGYLVISLLLLLIGPGRLSIDSLLFGRGPVLKPDPARDLSA